MLDVKQMRHYLVKPSLDAMGLWSQAAEDLVVGTMVQESVIGDGKTQYIHQLGNGPALGLFQMEPATHDWLMGEFLLRYPVLHNSVRKWTLTGDAEEMIWNHRYACIMCRIRYYAVPAALPPAGDIMAYANYWKKWYNTPAGAGTPMEFATKYQRFCV